MVTWSGELAFLDERARYHTFGIDPLRSLPTVLAGVLGNNDFIGPADKARIGLAGIEGLWKWARDSDETMAGVARWAGLDDATLNRVMRPLTRALFFLEPEELAAKAFVQLALQIAARPANIRAGAYRGGMGDLMIAPIVQWLQSNGATVRSGARIAHINYDAEANLVTGFNLESGEVLTGDVFVSALPVEGLQSLIPVSLRAHRYFSAILRIPTVPAISVQLWFDRKLVDRDTFTMLPDSSVPIMQDESFCTFVRSGSRISCQVTDRDTDNFTDEQYIECALSELSRFLPGLDDAVVQRSQVVRHRAFACTPVVVSSLRPDQASPVPNFFLAGDFTAQDWFVTMEGAARSGEMAAAAVLESHVLA